MRVSTEPTAGRVDVGHLIEFGLVDVAREVHRGGCDPFSPFDQLPADEKDRVEDQPVYLGR